MYMCMYPVSILVHMYYTCTYVQILTLSHKNDLKYKHSGATVGVVSIEDITVYYS
jgi:hypothetical protein